jgi:hypothetical protein
MSPARAQRLKILAAAAAVQFTAWAQAEASPSECSGAIQPIRGAWLNLPGLDRRNEFMTLPGDSGRDVRDVKIKEMSELGMEYLVVLFVANDGKAYYESGSFPPGYDTKGESPVPAAVRAADRYGLKVFLFDKPGALIPRLIECLLSDLHRFPSFEKILCCQYPGLMTAPAASIKPGGEGPVKQSLDYQQYLKRRDVKQQGGAR